MSGKPIAERFAEDTKTHRMDVRLDQGLYRHLVFRATGEDGKPASSAYWFELVTWPGHLTISGDMGTYTFARLPDMFEFFGHKDGINPSYWSQKLQGASQEGVKVYSEDLAKQTISELVDGHIEWHKLDVPQAASLRLAVEGEVLPEAEYEEGLRRTLDDFTWNPDPDLLSRLQTRVTLSKRGTPERDDAEAALRNCNGETFQFTDTWEMSFTEYGVHFLWCCHAVVWGIGQYRAAGGVIPVPGAGELEQPENRRRIEAAQAETVAVTGGVL